MRRLFSTFARGWPGVGLLLLRLVVGITLIGHVVEKLSRRPFDVFTLCLVALGLALLLLAGLWTPVVGAVISVLELGTIPWAHTALSTHIFMATMAAAVALVGPGFWSLDRRLYGWKRIDLPTPKA